LYALDAALFQAKLCEAGETKALRSFFIEKASNYETLFSVFRKFPGKDVIKGLRFVIRDCDNF
jgi:hypothetical protein